VAQFVAGRVKPGERVIVANNWTDLSFGWYWHREPRIVDVEKSPPRVDGPAWLVIAACGISPEVARIPLVREYRYTNHCEVRYIPAGQALEAPPCP